MQSLKQTERRTSARLPVALEDVAVYLDSRSQPLRVRAANLSLGGVFLYTHPVVLPTEGLVGLLFRHRGERYRVLAVVARRARNGAALKFVNSNPEVARMLRELTLAP